MVVMMFTFNLLAILVAVQSMIVPSATDKTYYDDAEYDPAEVSSNEFTPVPYNFGYNHEDNFGNVQHREENQYEDGVVRGSYGYRDPSGMYRHVSYVADADGFHAVLRTNEPGVGNKNSADVAVVAHSPSFNSYRRRDSRSFGIEKDE